METITPLIHWLQDFAYLLPWLGGTIFVMILLAGLTNCILRIADRQWFRKRKKVFLELTPPANTDKSTLATQQLFAVLHGLETTRPWVHKLLRRSASFSLEIVSTREQGIRFIVCLQDSDVPLFEQHIASYIPFAKCRRIEEYLPPHAGKYVRVLDFKQTGYFAYPFQLQGASEDRDPIAYLTGSMTKLEPQEMLAFQVVVTPTHVREAELLAGRLMHNQELVYSLGRRRAPIVRFVLDGVGTVLFGLIDAIGDITSGGAGRMVSQRDYYRKHEVAIKTRPARILSASEQELATAVQTKLGQPLFRANIRALIVANNEATARQRAKSVREALAVFRVPKYQSVQARATFPRRLKTDYRLSLFRQRLPALWHSSAAILASSEVADLYHFPHSESAKTDNIVKSLSKTLAAPISLKNGTTFDIILGRNHHHGTSTDIGLTEADRERHVYIIGGTGCGKTTMLTYAMIQDLQNGKGFAFIDPHGDAAELLLRHVPEERIGDVIYFNPDDLSYPIGLNVLELTPGLEGDELLREKDLVTESVISMFRKIFSDDDTGGHRIEYVLRNAIQTALYVEGATLFTVYNLLNDPDYCKKVVGTIDNDDLKKFWKNELGKAGGYQQVKMIAGITAKIGRFLFSASAKRVLEQPKSTINFDEVLNGKILICNFSKGLIGEDTSELFGVSVLAKIQMAALRRARIKQAERKPFYLYVDEFQNFATTSFVQMLSEARKYKLFLTMAEQSTSQQDDLQTVNVILANVGTVVCFRTGNPADERLLLPLFSPYVDEGEISRLSSYNFYMRIAATATQEPLSGETLLHDSESDEIIAKQVIETSRAAYAKPYQAKATEQQITSISTEKKLRKPRAKKKASQQEISHAFPAGQSS